MKNSILPILVGALMGAGVVALPDPPDRVAEFRWSRTVDGRTVRAKGKRVFWPGWDRKRIVKVIGDRDARNWTPPGATEHYWVILDSGEELELNKSTWSRLDVGSEVPR